MCVGTTKESKVGVLFPGGTFNMPSLVGFLLLFGGGSVETLLESHFLKTARSLLQNEMFSV